jgi:O-antigen ligase
MSTDWRLVIESEVVPTVLLMAGVLLCAFVISTLRSTLSIRAEPLRYFAIIDAAVAVVLVMASGRVIGAAQPPLGSAGVKLFTQIATIAVLIVAAERSLRFVALGEFRTVRNVTLLMTIVFYFAVVNLAAPLLGRNPELPPKLFYAPLLMVGLIALGAQDRERFCDTTRNVLTWFLVAGLVAIPFAPTLVMDLAYTEGFLPGLSIRYYGFSTHPNSLAAYVILVIGLLWMRPMHSRKLNRFAWLVAWTSLVLTQSKTSLGIGVVALCALWVFRRRQDLAESANRVRVHLWRRVTAGALVTASIATLVLLGSLLLGLVDPGAIAQRLDRVNFWTLTGRVRIWEISLSDLWDNPLFGRGGELWSRDYQREKGMFISHAHNQYVHTLGDTGFVGLAVLLLYCAMVGYAAWHARQATRGVSVALATYIFVRGMTEVPLIVDSVYGPEILTHAILLMLCVSPSDVLPRRWLGNSGRSQEPATAVGQPVAR